MALHPEQRKRHFPEELPVVWDPIRRDLKENEDWYRDLVEHSQDLLCVHDLEGRLLSVNPAPARLLGYSVEEALRMRIQDVIAPQFRDQCEAYLREIERTGESRGLLAVVTKTGEQRIWKYHSTLRTEGVAVPIVRGTAHDVTERVRAEKALQATNEQMLKTAQERERVLHELTLFRTLLDQSNDAIEVIDPETMRFLDVNESACAELGYSREELLSMTVLDISPDLDESALARVGQQLRESGSVIMEKVRRRKDGTTFPVEVNLREVLLDRKYGIAVSRDITERKRTEEARERLAAVVDSSDDAIITKTVDGTITSWNSGAERMFAYSSAEAVGKPMRMLLPPERANEESEILARIVRGEKVDHFETVRVRKDGKYIDVSATISPIRDSGGAIVGASKIARDITGRKRTERALRSLSACNESLMRATDEQSLLNQICDLVVNVGGYRMAWVGYAEHDERKTIRVAASSGFEAGYLDTMNGTWADEERGRGPTGTAIRTGEVTPCCDMTCDPGFAPWREDAIKRGYRSSLALPLKSGEEVLGAITIYATETGVFDAAEQRLLEELSNNLSYGIMAIRARAERKRADETLRQREETQKLILDHLSVGVILSSGSEQKVIYHNPRFLELFGYSLEQFTNVSEWWPLAYPDPAYREWVSREWNRRVSEAAKTQGEIEPMEATITCHDGTKKYVRATAKFIGGLNFVTFIDLSERRRAEEALRASKEELQNSQANLTALFESVTDLIWSVDSKCRLLTFNAKFAENFRKNYGKEVCVGATPQDLLPPDRAAKWPPMYERALAEGPFHQEYSLLDGRILEMRFNPLLREGKAVGVSVFAKDITEQKRAEEKLRQSEVELRQAQRIGRMGSWYRDLTTDTFTWSEQLYRLLGVDPKEPGPSFVRDERFFTHESYQRLIQANERIISTGKPNKIEVEFRRQDDGTTGWALLHREADRDEAGNIVGIRGIALDITERKRAEEAIATLVQVRADSSENFFNSMAVQLAKCLKADYTFIGELIEGEEDKLRTLGVCGQGVIVENYTYDLAHSPSETVILQGARSYVSGVAELFPKNDWLRQMKMESYTGTPLRDSQGRVIGVMVALYTRPLADAKFAEMILQLFSTRTAAEIERKRAEEALRQSEERFRVALKSSPTAVFNQDWDLRYTWMYNPQLPRTVSEYLGKTSDEIFDPEEAARITEVRRRVLETGVGSRHEMQFSFGGKKRYFDTTIEPVLDAAGAVIGITGATTDVTELREATEALREAKKKLTEEKLYLEREIDAELGFGDIIGQSKALEAVMENVGKVAASDATVLLLGETGTGKELVARAIHWLSLRSGNSFIKLNCAAIPTGLLESELFGNEKGAFTGAVSKKIGRIELADKGTLFLDEIGEISLALQPKLLRVLQDQEFERLGGTHTLKVDFRLIAATNRDLADAVRRNEFRSDLYYRLNVFPIRVPPLRERREDIRLLVEHFVQKFARRMNKSITSVPKRTMDALMGWEWPGNVRELENFIERSVILTQGSVLVAPLSELEPISTDENADETLEATEREHILRALRESHGQIGGLRGAAMRLGLKRTTLQSKLKHFGINPRSKPPEP
jgi:PAS domain S-box-containing protein